LLTIAHAPARNERAGRHDNNNEPNKTERRRRADMHTTDTSPTLTLISLDATRVAREAFHTPAYRAYLHETMAAFAEPLPAAQPIADTAVPRRVFEMLTAREYCYLSADRAAPYESAIVATLARAVAARAPLRFYLDLGGGYHAATEPGVRQPSYDVGLAELLVLRQIRTFVAAVARLYAPGARFTLIVGNVCAALIDEVPVERTRRYCERVRSLIAETSMSAIVELLVESEAFTLVDFERAGAAEPRGSANGKDAGASFLGRRCERGEAAERARLYDEVTAASERLLAQRIDGVRLAQRASATTLPFRAFLGGDARIQAGEVALLAEGSGRARPVLLTSRNVGDYSCLREAAPVCLPASIEHVLYARPFTG
jgi:hypothetical protein